MEFFGSYDLNLIKIYSLKEETVRKAHQKKLYENQEYYQWTENKKFIIISLNLNSNQNKKNIFKILEKGTNKILYKKQIEDNNEALEFYINMNENEKNFKYPLFLK